MCLSLSYADRGNYFKSFNLTIMCLERKTILTRKISLNIGSFRVSIEMCRSSSANDIMMRALVYERVSGVSDNRGGDQ